LNLLGEGKTEFFMVQPLQQAGRHSIIHLKRTVMPTTKSDKKQNNGSNGHAATVHTETQLEKFFHEQLKDIYWAERHLTKTLPKMRKAATTEELKEAIEKHLEQTMEHVNRLEQVFEGIGKKPRAKKCDGMDGLVKEGEHVIEETEKGSMTRDAGLIVAAQKVEHYEIATYGSLVHLATTMGLDKAASILQETLDEEKETDKILSSIAENSINWQAETEEVS
jgi:ferritin-like metal-binding protein YciE